MARLTQVVTVVPGFQNKGAIPWISYPQPEGVNQTTYAMKIEAQMDSCDGMAGTFGWDPVIIETGFRWTGTKHSLADLINKRLVARGWATGAAPGWAFDDPNTVWIYPKGHAATEELSLDSDEPNGKGDGWMITIEGRPKGPLVNCRG